MTESDYSSEIPDKLYTFINESTAWLFFLPETTSSSFVNKFSLSPRIKQYRDVDGRDRDAYTQGNWIRAHGGKYILVGNGLGNIETYFSPSGFPREFFIYQYLDDKY